MRFRHGRQSHGRSAHVGDELRQANEGLKDSPLALGCCLRHDRPDLRLAAPSHECGDCEHCEQEDCDFNVGHLASFLGCRRRRSAALHCRVHCGRCSVWSGCPRRCRIRPFAPLRGPRFTRGSRAKQIVARTPKHARPTRVCASLLGRAASRRGASAAPYQEGDRQRTRERVLR